MIGITQYLQEVYEDLQKYVDNDVCLCKFKKLNFEAGSLPDYEDINIQQLYNFSESIKVSKYQVK